LGTTLAEFIDDLRNSGVSDDAITAILEVLSYIQSGAPIAFANTLLALLTGGQFTDIGDVLDLTDTTIVIDLTS
jgi:hypothetical protein